MTAPRPPGPRGAALLRTALGRRSNPIRLVQELFATYGDIVYIRLGSMRQFLVSDPEAARHVLVTNHQNYTKGPGYEHLARLLGHGLITSEGERWRTHRRIVQPILRRERLAVFVRVMAEAAEEEASALEGMARANASVDALVRMKDLTMRIVARALLGEDVRGREADVHRALDIVFDHVERLSTSKSRYVMLIPGARRLATLARVAEAFPSAQRKRFGEALTSLDAVIYEAIARRRVNGPSDAQDDDLIGLLLAATAEDGAVLSDEDVRDEVMTMFVAGHETVATSLTWCLYLLAQHPVYQGRIVSEGQGVLGARAPTLDDLSGLETAGQVFQEALRLYPSVWRLSRFAVGPDRIAGFQIPAGAIVTICPYLLHRHPALWSEPERFDPERFVAEDAPAPVHGVYLPFGAGQRKCPGGAFAMAEAKIILTAVCRRVRWEPVLDAEPRFERRIALHPRGGMPLRLASLQPQL